MVAAATLCIACEANDAVTDQSGYNKNAEHAKFSKMQKTEEMQRFEKSFGDYSRQLASDPASRQKATVDLTEKAKEYLAYYGVATTDIPQEDLLKAALDKHLEMIQKLNNNLKK